MQSYRYIEDIDSDNPLSGDYLEIYMEDIGGKSLQYVASQLNGLSLDVVRIYSKKILSALSHLHKNNIIHMDIKADNILLSADGEVKIIDFGESILLSDVQQQLNAHANTHTRISKEVVSQQFTLPYTGTESHIAPELLDTRQYNKKYIGKNDIWSFGITLVELFFGNFNDLREKKKDEQSLMRQIINKHNSDYIKVANDIIDLSICYIYHKAQYKNSNNNNINFNNTAKNLAGEILIDDIFTDDIKSFVDFILCCLESDYNKRLSADSLLQHQFITQKENSLLLSSSLLSQ
jgi:serine/threonine protein kinase